MHTYACLCTDFTLCFFADGALLPEAMHALKVSMIFSNLMSFAALATVETERLVPGCSVMRSDHLGHVLLYGGASATGTCNGTSDPKVFCLCPINCPSTYKGTMEVDLSGKFSLNLASLPQCTKDLEEDVACTIGYEPILEGDKQVCTKRRAGSSTACQSAKVFLVNNKSITNSNNRSVVSGQRVRVNVARKYGTCQVRVVPLNQAKTAKLNEELLLTIPVKHQVGIFNCTNSPDCTLPALDVVCPEGQKIQHGVCAKPLAECAASENQVVTESGGCAPLELRATARSDSLVVNLVKANRDLEGVPVTRNVTVGVGPTAKYALNITSQNLAVEKGLNWVQLGDLRKLDE